LRTWIKQSPLLTLRNQDKQFGAAGQTKTYDYPNPRAKPPQPPTWTAWFNLNLRGLDSLPKGKAISDLVPRSPPLELAQRTWTNSYILSLIGQDGLPTGARIYDAPPRMMWLRDWSENLLLSTLAITPSPFGPFDWPLPGRAGAAPRDWSQNLLLSTLAVTAAPFGPFDWPLPMRPGAPSQSWAAWYNLNLIGQDQLACGAQVSDLVPRAAPLQLAQRTWFNSYILSLIGQDALPVGLAISALPSRISWSRDWSQNLLLSTLGLQAPFGPFDWPLPRGFAPQVPSWTWAYNLNLIGQDQLAPGIQTYDLPRIAQRLADEGWASFPFALNAPVPTAPPGGIITDLPAQFRTGSLLPQFAMGVPPLLFPVQAAASEWIIRARRRSRR